MTVASTDPRVPAAPLSPLSIVRLDERLLARGTETFCEDVARVVAALRRTPTGPRLLAELAGAPKTVTIEETRDGNAYCVPRDLRSAIAPGRPMSAVPGTPDYRMLGTGGGSDVTVLFNPEVWLPNKTAPRSPMPPDAVLVYVLNLALLCVQGRSRAGEESPDGWDTRDARTAILESEVGEMAYLRDIGFGYRRKDHRTDFVVDPGRTEAP